MDIYYSAQTIKSLNKYNEFINNLNEAVALMLNLTCRKVHVCRFK